MKLLDPVQITQILGLEKMAVRKIRVGGSDLKTRLTQKHVHNLKIA